MIRLINETEKALDERLEITNHTNKKFEQAIYDKRWFIGQLRFEQENLRNHISHNDNQLLNVIESNSKIKDKISELHGKLSNKEYKNYKHVLLFNIAIKFHFGMFFKINWSQEFLFSI